MSFILHYNDKLICFVVYVISMFSIEGVQILLCVLKTLPLLDSIVEFVHCSIKSRELIRPCHDLSRRFPSCYEHIEIELGRTHILQLLDQQVLICNHDFVIDFLITAFKTHLHTAIVKLKKQVVKVFFPDFTRHPSIEFMKPEYKFIRIGTCKLYLRFIGMRELCHPDILTVEIEAHRKLIKRNITDRI